LRNPPHAEDCEDPPPEESIVVGIRGTLDCDAEEIAAVVAPRVTEMKNMSASRLDNSDFHAYKSMVVDRTATFLDMEKSWRLLFFDEAMFQRESVELKRIRKIGYVRKRGNLKM
jgi:hypothetical protein